MNILKTLGIAGGLIVAALVGGTMISAVFAAPGGTAGEATDAATLTDKAVYCDTWKEAFADALGVSVDDLLPAAKAATIAVIDEAIANEAISAERGAALKEKVRAWEGDACRLLGHPFFFGGDRHFARVGFGVDLIGAAADALGMEPSALIEALRSGSSLQEVASDEGKSYDAVSQAVHDAAKANLDEQVAAGNLEQLRADQLLANLDEALSSGEWPRHGPWHRGLHPDRDGLEDLSQS